MKKYTLTILLSLLSFNFYCQQLSIPETLRYINNKTFSNHYVALSAKGEFFWMMLYNKKFWHNPIDYDNWVKKITDDNNYHITTSDIKEIKTTKFLKTDIRKLEFSITRSGGYYISLRCKTEGCIQTIEEKGIYRNNYEDSELILNEEDYENNKKLVNALYYLQSLIENNQKYNIIDNDPFSESNYSSLKSKKNSIPLKNENGVFKITVSVSNQPFDFILDSGASEISISKEIEMILKDKNIISNLDYIEPGLYRIADGSIISCKRVVLKNLQIGDIKIKNVIASIGVSNTPLLLGRNFFDNFKSWKIDNEERRLVIELR